MQTIADAAKVSRATVSRALRNHPNLPIETRQRIQAVARQFGYRPNPMVAALMAQLKAVKRSDYVETLAFVTAWPTRDGWRKFYETREFFSGAMSRSRQLGYTLEHFWLKESGMTGQRFSQMLSARGIRGLVINPLLRPMGHLSLNWEQFAAVTIGASLRQPDLHRVCIHQYANVGLAYRKLKHLGFRRIGLFTLQDLERRVDYERTASMYAYQNWISPAHAIPSLVIGEWKEQVFRRWLKDESPDAIIAVHYHILNQSLADILVCVPKNVGFVALNWSDSYPHITGVDTNPNLIGAASVDLLVEQLHNNECGIPSHPKTVLIKGKWVEGNSVRVLRRSADKLATA